MHDIQITILVGCIRVILCIIKIKWRVKSKMWHWWWKMMCVVCCVSIRIICNWNSLSSRLNWASSSICFSYIFALFSSSMYSILSLFSCSITIFSSICYPAFAFWTCSQVAVSHQYSAGELMTYYYWRLMH